MIDKGFDASKGQILRDLHDVVDKSPKGAVDEPIVDFLMWFNALPNYVSTSSCSGRISLFYVPSNTYDKSLNSSSLMNDDATLENGAAQNGTGTEPEDGKYSGSSFKGQGKWLLAAHRRVSIEETKELVNGCSNECSRLLLKVEPFILHVQCRDLESAKTLLGLASQAGFRESGIVLGKKIMVQIRSTATCVQVPVVIDGIHVVADASMNRLMDYCNNRFDENLRRVRLLEQTLRQYFPASMEDRSMSNCCEDPRELARWGLTSTTITLSNGKTVCVAYGGCGGTTMQRLSSVIVFDWGTNRWYKSSCESTEIPEARIKHAACRIDIQGREMVLIHGGRASPSKPFGDMWIMHLETDEFSFQHVWYPVRTKNANSLPSCWGHQLVSIKQSGTTFLFGGRNATQCFAWLFKISIDDKYNSEVMELSNAIEGPSPAARYGHGMCILKNKLMLHGGYNFSRPGNVSRSHGRVQDDIFSDKSISGRLLGDFWVFNVDSWNWYQPQLNGVKPSPRFFHHLKNCGDDSNKIIVLGGATANYSEQHLCTIDTRNWYSEKIAIRIDSKDDFENNQVDLALSYLCRSGCSFLKGHDEYSDSLILIGGGGLTFSFGAFYCPPLKIDLESLSCKILMPLNWTGESMTASTAQRRSQERQALLVPASSTEAARFILQQDGLLNEQEKIVRCTSRPEEAVEEHVYSDLLKLDKLARDLVCSGVTITQKQGVLRKAYKKKDKKPEKFKQSCDGSHFPGISALMLVPISRMPPSDLLLSDNKPDKLKMFRKQLYAKCPIRHIKVTQSSSIDSDISNTVREKKSCDTLTLIVPKQVVMPCSAIMNLIGILDLEKKVKPCTDSYAEKVKSFFVNDQGWFSKFKLFIEALTEIPLDNLNVSKKARKDTKKPKKPKPMQLTDPSWISGCNLMCIPLKDDPLTSLKEKLLYLKSVDIRLEYVTECMEPLLSSSPILSGGNDDASRIEEAALSQRTWETRISKCQNFLKHFLHQHGLPMELESEIPTKLEQFGDALMLSRTDLRDERWLYPQKDNERKSSSPLLWSELADLLDVRLIARRSEIANTRTRDSKVELLFGDSPWVHIKENGITYALDITKVMFSTGNDTEKARVGRLFAEGEIVADFFAGIGYFTIPYLVHAKAAMVHACDINPSAIECLEKNLKLNGVQDRAKVYSCDNVELATQIPGVADRINLGLLPSSEESWSTAVKVLKPEGGWMHVHGNVAKKEATVAKWGAYVRDQIQRLADIQCKHWRVSCTKVGKVKSYAPNVLHCVADIHCSPKLANEEEIHQQVIALSMKTYSSKVGRPLIPSLSATTLSRHLSVQLNEHTADDILWCRRLPIVLKDCVSSSIQREFDPQRLKTGEQSHTQVSVHVSPKQKMSFTDKNFEFQMMSLAHLLEICENMESEGSIYLRAVGSNPRRSRAHFWSDFPQLGRKFPFTEIKWLIPSGQYFSSVLRIASPHMTLWTHYDVMDNILIQLHGRKRVILFPPSCADCLYLSGSSSSVLEWKEADISKYPLAKYAVENSVEIVLEPGDALFIPALWCHSVTSLQGTSVAVNVFWKDSRLPEDMRSSKDLYGNADPSVVGPALTKAEELHRHLSDLPGDYYDFYTRKVLAEGFGHTLKVDPV